MVKRLKRGWISVDGVSIRIRDIRSCNVIGKYFPPDQNKVGRVQNYFSINTYSGCDFLSPASPEIALKKISKIYDIIGDEKDNNLIAINDATIRTNEKQILYGS